MYRIKYSKQKVAGAIRNMAKTLKEEHVVNDDTVFLVMLTGGVWFATHLFDALGDMPNEVYYIKGHSYASQSREQFVWDYIPNIDLRGRNVVIIDDICDSGETIKAAYEKLSPVAKSITAITLMRRIPNALPQEIKLYACIDDDSTQFFVGCGLDDNGPGRLLRHIGIC
ncbi:MAG: hypothetical protein KBS40_00235 [Bacteroidales bacterium]|nr:hypothetical protein [Bacteroidales bacterium]